MDGNLQNLCDSITKYHTEIVEELSKPGKEDEKVRRIPIIHTKYLLVYDKMMVAYNKQNAVLDTLFKDLYYKIKIGSHELSNLSPTSHQEIKTLVQHEDSYIQEKLNLETIESCLKKIEKMMKTVQDYSFHFRFVLDYEKFKSGE